jgi:hypothetical protein
MTNADKIFISASCVLLGGLFYYVSVFGIETWLVVEICESICR